MQGSFGDAQERFRGGKAKDKAQKKYHQEDSKFRKRRINRHQSQES